MSSEVFQLFLLLQLKDFASGGLNRIQAELRATGKEAGATLQKFQSLREGMSKGLQIAGIGVAGLLLMKKGIDAAGDYESSILDLRNAYQETAAAGALSAQEQESQLKGLSSLAVDLGNKLQGNTKDYAGILASLKQAGLPGEQVLGGAGRSAAYLANVTGALQQGRAREQAKELGQFGLMFKLRPEEFEASVNLFSALKDKFDIESSSLIESAKYFQATSNQFGVTGAKGAGDTLKFFALLKRTAGMEGSLAGTGARSFFMQLATEEKKLAKLKKATGIELRPFDDKGQFRGYEAMFSEMEKFRGLNQKESAKWLNDIFGLRGQEVASAMVQSGVEGWKKITAESAKAVPVNEKIVQQMATYNAKVEALTGSLQNLTATAFLPMLDTVKPLVDKGNEIVGWVQQLSAEHPGLTGIAGDFAGIALTALTVVGVLKAGVNAWGLYTLATGAAARALQAEAIAAGEATVATGAASSRLLALQKMSALRMTVTIAAVFVGFELIQWLREQQQKYEKETADARQKIGDTHVEAMQNFQLYGPRSREAQLQRQLQEKAAAIPTMPPGARAGADIELRGLREQLEKERANRAMQEKLATESWASFQFGGPEVIPFLGSEYLGRLMGGVHPMEHLDPANLMGSERRGRTVQELRGLGGGVLSDPNVLAKLLRAGERGDLKGVKSPQELESFKTLLKEAVGDPTFRQASEIASQDMKELGDQAKQTATNFQDITKWFGPLPTSFDRARFAVDRFSIRLGGWEPPSFSFGGPQSSTPGTPQVNNPYGVNFGGPKAGGGRVLKGVNYIGGERGAELFTPDRDGWVTPNNQLRRLSTLRETSAQPRAEFRPDVARAIVAEFQGRGQAGRQTVHHHGNRTVNVHLHGVSTNDPEELARQVARAVEIQMERA